MDQPEKSDLAKREEETLAFWKERRIFERSLEKPAPAGDFVFYEGPPTANGKPGIHHLESRSFKDLIPRYKTMRGFRVPRKAGWDTHGLPVELEVEKRLGFSGKKDIEEYGIAAFNAKCRDSVHEYVDVWERFTERIGYWVDKDDAYFTYDSAYMEALWSALKGFEDRLIKDYKVLPWCPSCGTALSSHELAQGYEDVKDLSVTAKFELLDEPGTYLLAWTTTPWTLPGNVALAVGEEVEYSYAKTDAGTVIAATARLSALGLSDVVKTVKGRDLVGRTYKPLYDFLPALASDTERSKFEKAYAVYPASFVTTEDGTGIVHTAVMYGQEDFELGTAIGLPKVHAVGLDGKFLAGAGAFEGRFVKDEAVAVDIVKDLAARGLLFSKEKYAHSYPHCWRCKTPLIYYARDSWYIRMHDLREALVAENAAIDWEPEHIKEGRMGEWLAGVKDWAVSRERYWGTPLPVWESADRAERIVIGSVEELKERTKKSGNRYLLMRHGEAGHNVASVLNGEDRDAYPLTERGRAQVMSAAEKLVSQGITHIIASPFLRARETAELVRQHLGLPEQALTVDERIREFGFGRKDGGPFAAFAAFRDNPARAYEDRIEGGESYLDVKRRFAEFLYDCEATRANETVLVVTHGAGFEVLASVARGATMKESDADVRSVHAEQAEVRELPFVPLPHDADYALDLHRPYIDEVVLVGDSGTELRRTKEVMDVWFDSGGMPFAVQGNGYPADYISEAIDQTRGWFYTLLALGVLRGEGAPYRHVICLGHLLDKDGQKMSKSRGNVVEPFAALDRWGADPLRMFMYSVTQPGDSKNFDPDAVDDIVKKLVNPVENTLAFLELYGDLHATSARGNGVLDRWLRARTAALVRTVTERLDAYDVFPAARAFREYAADLSQWYVRRSRDRIKGEERLVVSAELRAALRTFALTIAPFMPFFAERLWQKLREETDPESVHLAEWPVPSDEDTELLTAMDAARDAVTALLERRQKAGVKVRQPLARATVPGLSDELRAIVAEEINVKEVAEGAAIELDTAMTQELIDEGALREFVRAVMDARKSEGLVPGDAVSLTVATTKYRDLIAAHEESLMRTLSAKGIRFGSLGDSSYTATLPEEDVAFSLS